MCFYSKEKSCWYSPWHWEGECEIIWCSKKVQDEVLHAQFCAAAISIKHPRLEIRRWAGAFVLHLHFHICIDLRFHSCPPPTTPVVLTAPVGSIIQGSLNSHDSPRLFVCSILGHRWCCGWAWTQSVPFFSKAGSECSFAQLSFSMGLTAALVFWKLVQTSWSFIRQWAELLREGRLFTESWFASET